LILDDILKSMKKNYYILILVGIPFLLLAYGLRPIIKPDLNSCEVVEGTIVKLHEGGELDLVVRLKGENKDFYYINRGLEHSFQIEDIKDWNNRQAKIWYVERWIMRLLGNSSWHIARLDINGDTVYDETAE